VRDERRLDMHHVDPARIDTSERAVECAADHQPIFRVHRHASRSDAVHARIWRIARPVARHHQRAAVLTVLAQAPPEGGDRGRDTVHAREEHVRNHQDVHGGPPSFDGVQDCRAQMTAGLHSVGQPRPDHSAALVSTTGIGDRSAQPADVPAHTVIVGCQRPRPIVAGSDTRLQPLGRAAIGGCEPAA